MIAVPFKWSLGRSAKEYQLFKVLYKGCVVRCSYYFTAGVIYVYATGVVIIPQDYFVLGGSGKEPVAGSEKSVVANACSVPAE